MDAVLHEQDYLATSEGTKLPSLKSFRKSEKRLALVSRRKENKTKGTKARLETGDVGFHSVQSNLPNSKDFENSPTVSFNANGEVGGCQHLYFFLTFMILVLLYIAIRAGVVKLFVEVGNA